MLTLETLRKYVDAVCVNFLELDRRVIALETAVRRSTSGNKPSTKSCANCGVRQRDRHRCFDWPECSLTFDKWKPRKTSCVG